jgi:hypothetical protein
MHEANNMYRKEQFRNTTCFCKTQHDESAHNPLIFTSRLLSVRTVASPRRFQASSAQTLTWHLFRLIVPIALVPLRIFLLRFLVPMVLVLRFHFLLLEPNRKWADANEPAHCRDDANERTHNITKEIKV